MSPKPKLYKHLPVTNPEKTMTIKVGLHPKAVHALDWLVEHTQHTKRSGVIEEALFKYISKMLAK